jgi:hypothetical protein
MRKSLGYLRIAFSATCIIACVLLIALWVRSYWWDDSVDGHFTEFQLFHVNSIQGQVAFLTFPKSTQVLVSQTDYRGTLKHAPMGLAAGDFRTHSPYEFAGLGFSRVEPNGGIAVLVPQWFLISLAAILAATPWGHWRWRFSLRTLLIATTLIAVVLGMVIYFSTRPPTAPRFDQGFGR